MRTLIRTALFALVLLPTQAVAWGGAGHRIACGVTWQRLTPQARELVTKVLGTSEEKAFVDGCVWADSVRPSRPETSAFHYINIPAGAGGMTMRRDCGDTDKRCVTWAIAHYSQQLGDPETPAAARREALLFIMHFVGDLHQPLHAGRPEDRGGNSVAVDFFGNAGSTERPMNLHSVWDSQILQRANGQWPALSQQLAAAITDDDVKKWESLDVVAWTNESYQICEEYVYGKLPADRKIRNFYYQPALGYSQAQLQKAGVRLAYLIDQIAAGKATIVI